MRLKFRWAEREKREGVEEWKKRKEGERERERERTNSIQHKEIRRLLCLLLSAE